MTWNYRSASYPKLFHICAQCFVAALLFAKLTWICDIIYTKYCQKYEGLNNVCSNIELCTCRVVCRTNILPWVGCVQKYRRGRAPSWTSFQSWCTCMTADWRRRLYSPYLSREINSVKTHIYWSDLNKIWSWNSNRSRLLWVLSAAVYISKLTYLTYLTYLT